MRIDNELIGKYHGIPVYKSNIVDYVTYRRYYDEENMYLINGELIYKNEIFARYDGNYVTEYDFHQRATYYTIPQRGSDSAVKEQTSTSSIGTEDAVAFSNSETKTEDTPVSSDFKPKDVEATLAGVYETDYFGSMTDIDAFLKVNLES